MQFPGSDGQAVSVDDIRRVTVLARLSKVVLPKERRPANSIISTMIALPQERRPASTIMGSMKV
jgi:hypothetical protein